MFNTKSKIPKLKIADKDAMMLHDAFGLSQKRTEIIQRFLQGVMNAEADGDGAVSLNATELFAKLRVLCVTYEEFLWAVILHTRVATMAEIMSNQRDMEPSYLSN